MFHIFLDFQVQNTLFRFQLVLCSWQVLNCIINLILIVRRNFKISFMLYTSFNILFFILLFIINFYFNIWFFHFFIFLFIFSYRFIWALQLIFAIAVGMLELNSTIIMFDCIMIHIFLFLWILFIFIVISKLCNSFLSVFLLCVTKNQQEGDCDAKNYH